MPRDELTKEKRTELATEVAEEISKGGITPKAIKSFAKLIEDGGVLDSPPYFGNGLLPDDDW